MNDKYGKSLKHFYTPRDVVEVGYKNIDEPMETKLFLLIVSIGTEVFLLAEFKGARLFSWPCPRELGTCFGRAQVPREAPNSLGTTKRRA